MKIKYIIILLSVCGLLSCSHYKDIPYFQNAAEVDLSQSAYLYDLIIQPQDQLNIFVSSSVNEEYAATFNQRERIGVRPGQKIGSENNLNGFYRYLVDVDGNIEFPMVGKIHVAGLTIEQVSAVVKDALQSYFKDDKSFMVNTYMMNYSVSVLGEVKSPGTFDVTRNKMTVLEALAKAGDMTIYGKRDNLKILRELPDGTYEVHELDMRDANILNSPYYYLQQNDIIYVEPNKAKAQNSGIGNMTTLWFSATSIIVSLASLLVNILR